MIAEIQNFSVRFGGNFARIKVVVVVGCSSQKPIQKLTIEWAVVVAQLVERSLLIPEVRGSNPVIGKKLFILNICLLSTVC